MNVINMTSKSGNKIANQFIIDDATIKHTTPNGTEDFFTGRMFQSYNSNIVFITCLGEVLLDETYWNYSVTTSKYRNIFLNEDSKTTEKKIASGQYKLANLN